MALAYWLSCQSSTEPSSSSPNKILTIVGVVGTLLLFVLILYLAYLPNRAGPVDKARIEQRKQNLAENQASEIERATTYAWVDRENGIVRIPIEKAMDLTVKDWQESQ